MRKSALIGGMALALLATFGLFSFQFAAEPPPAKADDKSKKDAEQKKEPESVALEAAPLKADDKPIVEVRNESTSEAMERVHGRMEALKRVLDQPVGELEGGEVGLSLLLKTLSDFVTPPGSNAEPGRKVTIIVSPKFGKTDPMFDPERRQIRLPSRLAAMSLATVLGIICEQLDATYIVRRDYIEIIPLEAVDALITANPVVTGQSRRHGLSRGKAVGGCAEGN